MRMRMSLRIMMVATVNEEGSSCSKLAANFSRLAGLCIHILHQYTAPFKTFTSMHQCSAYVEYKLFCPIKLDYASTFCINTLHPSNTHLQQYITIVHQYIINVYNSIQLGVHSASPYYSASVLCI